jgi:hypothetical protein
MKILDFKSISPLFEMERDGIKPFNTRKVDYKDAHFRALAQWDPSRSWAIRITNPATGESFTREIKSVGYVYWVDWHIALQPNSFFTERLQVFEGWKIIVMGEIVPS